MAEFLETRQRPRRPPQGTLPLPRCLLMTRAISPEHVAEVRLVIELGVVRLPIARHRGRHRAARRRLRALGGRAGARRVRHRAFDRVPHPCTRRTTLRPRWRRPVPGPAVEGRRACRGTAAPLLEMSVSEHIELLDAVTRPAISRSVIAKHLMRKTSVDESIFKMD